MRDTILQLREGLHSSTRLKLIDPTVTAEISDCLQKSIPGLCGKRMSHHVCPDKTCRTAFWLEINLEIEYRLVVEISKVGKYARVYWKRRRSLSTDYSATIPPADRPEYGNCLRYVEQAISQCGVSLLNSEELDERVPLSSDELNPSDEATVASLVFGSEYH